MSNNMITGLIFFMCFSWMFGWLLWFLDKSYQRLRDLNHENLELKRKLELLKELK